MKPAAIKRRAERSAKRVARYCKGCCIELVDAKQAQQYCSPICRRKNYIWDSSHAECVSCGVDKKYRTQSYCIVCLQCRRHNITREDLENVLLSQFYRCGVCLKEIEEEYQIDHDHRCCTGAYSCGSCVRGIIHSRCNTAMGNFDDDPKRLRQAADYIERFTVK